MHIHLPTCGAKSPSTKAVLCDHPTTPTVLSGLYKTFQAALGATSATHQWPWSRLRGALKSHLPQVGICVGITN